MKIRENLVLICISLIFCLFAQNSFAVGFGILYDGENETALMPIDINDKFRIELELSHNSSIETKRDSEGEKVSKSVTETREYGIAFLRKDKKENVLLYWGVRLGNSSESYIEEDVSSDSSRSYSGTYIRFPIGVEYYLTPNLSIGTEIQIMDAGKSEGSGDNSTKVSKNSGQSRALISVRWFY